MKFGSGNAEQRKPRLEAGQEELIAKRAKEIRGNWKEMGWRGTVSDELRIPFYEVSENQLAYYKAFWNIAIDQAARMHVIHKNANSNNERTLINLQLSHDRWHVIAALALSPDKTNLDSMTPRFQKAYAAFVMKLQTQMHQLLHLEKNFPPPGAALRMEKEEILTRILNHETKDPLPAKLDSPSFDEFIAILAYDHFKALNPIARALVLRDKTFRAVMKTLYDDAKDPQQFLKFFVNNTLPIMEERAPHIAKALLAEMNGGTRLAKAA